MKKSLFIFILCISCFQCTKVDIQLLKPKTELNLPKDVEKNGKIVAENLYETIVNLHKMEVSYEDADLSIDFKNRFFSDYYTANSTSILTKSSYLSQQMLMDSRFFLDRYRLLTNIQLKFIDRIIRDYEHSRTYDDIRENLRVIAFDIYKQVPKIEQERLLNIISILYYTSIALQDLEEQGLMFATPKNSIKRLKTKSAESGNIGDYCRKIMATVWTIAIGEPTITGEIVAAISTVIIGGVLLYEVIVCNDNTHRYSRDECIELYSSCATYAPKSDCSTCLQFCITQGIWPWDRCDWNY